MLPALVEPKDESSMFEATTNNLSVSIALRRSRPRGAAAGRSSFSAAERVKCQSFLGLHASRGPSAHGLDPWGTRALPALASPCSRRRATLSSGEPVRRPPGPALGRPEDRLRVPQLCGPALAVTAAHGPAYQPSRPQPRRCGPAAEPWREARSQAAALIASSARFARSSRLVRSRRR
jgi:hypothetical protein